MKKNVKANMEKKLQKKKEIEKISNKTLTVFSVGLAAEVALLFIYSALKANSSYLNKTLPWFSLAMLLVFAGMFIASTRLAKKEGKSAKSKGLKNWSFCVLAVSFAAFYLKAGVVITALLKLFGAEDAGSFMAVKLSNITGKNGSIYLMIAVAVYVIAVFIYYNLKIKKIKKSK